jgi:hypothetical protein
MSSTSSRTLCVILRTSASAIRTSSWVNLSSFLSASSRSVIPVNFLKNFPAHRSIIINRQPIGNSLVDPRLISFVAIPKTLSTSTIISVIMSAIAAVGVTSVYVSRRLKKYPMRSNSSARTSLLAATSLAAYRSHRTFNMRTIRRKNEQNACLHEDTDSCKDGIRRRKYLQNICQKTPLYLD